jgi:hypothetical protein
MYFFLKLHLFLRSCQIQVLFLQVLVLQRLIAGPTIQSTTTINPKVQEKQDPAAGGKKEKYALETQSTIYTL